MSKVTKRDGRIVQFDKNKIIDALKKAFANVDGELTEDDILKINTISNSIENENKDLNVEEIQDIIEKKLMSSNRKDVAKSYILYRNDRTLERSKRSKLNKTITKRLKAINTENQNANVDERSFGGKMGAVSSDVLKEYALNNCMSRKSRENHLNNEIYIHDLDSYAIGSHNCLSIPFDDLLAKGFNTRQTDVRPANSINTAFQLVAVIFQLQSLQQFGGVSATHLDWTMIPYVRKSFYKHFIKGLQWVTDARTPFRIYTGVEEAQINPIDICIEDDFYKGIFNNTLKQYQNDILKAYNYAMESTEKELNQAVEGMYHNLNTLQSRSGNQLPFTSINYGTCTLPEGRMVTKALINGSIKGVGKFHKTSIFPCGIFQCMKGINRKPNDPNYDLFQLALRSTAQRLYPNYANCDWSGNEGYDINDPRTYFSTMGCRTANGFDANGFGQLKDGRGNICPVTIIMPTLAMEIDGEVGNKDVDEFIKLLDKKIYEAKDMLIERFDWISSQSPKSANFMYENNTMVGYVPEEGIISALKHGTLAIGQLGLAETLQILIGCDHTTKKGMDVAKHIEQLFKNRCAEFKKELHHKELVINNETVDYTYYLNFGVYYTPAENLCYTAMQKFKEQYGEISNVSDKEFFTNSIHVPVWINMSPIEKINIESQLTGYSSAGCITYIELEGSIKNNPVALETLVNYAMDKDIPYFAINVPNDMCNDCGYTDDMNDTCPECGGHDIRRLRRVTGYLTGDYTTAFNKGKQQEVEMRVKHR